MLAGNNIDGEIGIRLTDVDLYLSTKQVVGTALSDDGMAG